METVLDNVQSNCPMELPGKEGEISGNRKIESNEVTAASSKMLYTGLCYSAHARCLLDWILTI